MLSLRVCVDSSLILPFLCCTDIHKASLSRPLFGPKSSSTRLNQNQDPSKGQFQLNQHTLAPVPGQVSPSGSMRLGSSVL